MPASAATAATVSGRSPERTAIRTPCARRNATVSRASLRSRSPRTTRPSELPDRERRVRRRCGRARCRTRRRAGRTAPLRRRPPAGRRAGRARVRRARTSSRRAAPRSSAGATRTARPHAAPPPRRCECSAIAASVAFRVGELSANRPSACASSPSSTPSAGRIDSTWMRASVSVPVLSMQIVSTEASDSIAFSCCVSAPRRAMRIACDGVREAREQDQSLRDERDDGGDRRRHRVVHRRVAAVERPHERDAERDQHARPGSAGAG